MNVHRVIPQLVAQRKAAIEDERLGGPLTLASTRKATYVGLIEFGISVKTSGFCTLLITITGPLVSAPFSGPSQRWHERGALVADTALDRAVLVDRAHPRRHVDGLRGDRSDGRRLAQLAGHPLEADLLRISPWARLSVRAWLLDATL